jgi:hypothetical protein
MTVFFIIHEKYKPEKFLSTLQWIGQNKSTHPLNEFFFQALVMNKKNKNKKNRLLRLYKNKNMFSI